MKLTSPAFAPDKQLPVDATCGGQAISPALSIGEVPVGTVSLALIMHDPDGINGDFTHWLVWNIPSNTTELPEGQSPQGAIIGTNDYAKTAYGPACPPPGSGLHHYVFELYAVDTMPDVPAGANRIALEHALQGHTLATTQLIGTVAS
jgi:Raf kinase inhibitor-like YbhB/YbcL family protein